MSEQEQTVVRPSKIELRTKSLTDEHVQECLAFYEELKQKDKELEVVIIEESSEATKTYIQIDFYSKDGSQLDGVMIPYKE